MVKEVVVCGDSFGTGSGLVPKTCFEKSFGGLVAKHYNVPHTVYARGGCCNFVIYLQVKKVIADYKWSLKKPFVLVTTTHHSRFTFPADGNTGQTTYDLSDVDYLNYPPYSKFTPEEERRSLPFKLSAQPKLVSETVSNIIYFLRGETPNLKNLFSRIGGKLNAVKHYYEELYDDEIKHCYDDGILLLAHSELKAAGFDHLIMTPEKERHKFIDEKNLFINNWGEYSQKYPDAYGSGHCDERGHAEVANKIIKRIENYK